MDGERVPDGFTEQTARVGTSRSTTSAGAGAGRWSCCTATRNVVHVAQGAAGACRALHGHRAGPAGSRRQRRPGGGYDKKTLAADVHGLLTQLGLAARSAWSATTSAPWSRTPTPPRTATGAQAGAGRGADPGPEHLPVSVAHPHRAGCLELRLLQPAQRPAEQVVAGREALWVDRFTDSMKVQKAGIGEDDVRIRALPPGRCPSAGQLRVLPGVCAGCRRQRRVWQDETHHASARPGARVSLGEAVATQVAQYATTVSGGVIEDSGHWLFEEQPTELTEQLLHFLRQP